MTEAEHRQHILAADLLEAWDYGGACDEGVPFERKQRDWGWLDGRAVAVDYANLDEGSLRQIYNRPA